MTGVIATANVARVDGPRPLRRSGRVFGGSADQVAAVRRFIRSEIADHPACDDAVRVASELAANAIVHTKSGDDGIFMVDIAAIDAEHVALVVTDQGTPTAPRAKEPGLNGESGRGLMVVIALATLIVVLGDCSMRTVAAVIPASSEHHDGGNEMTESINEAPTMLRSSLERQEIRDSTLSAARQFLADTVEAINPGTPARELLAYATQSRAHLAAVVAANSGTEVVAASSGIRFSTRKKHDRWRWRFLERRHAK